MAKLTWRQEAINDLSDIWNYTVDVWSENQADKYYQSLKFACQEISRDPTIGKTYGEVDKNLKGYRINKHLIFYHSVSANEVEIIRILHERMDLKSQLKPF